MKKTLVFTLILAAAVTVTSSAAPVRVHLTWQDGSTANNITVNWMSSDGTDETVYYGETEDYGSTKASTHFYSGTCGQNIHIAELTGLKANTQYHYKIGASGDNHTFMTAPEEGSTKAFTFAALGDSRSDDSIRNTIKNRIKARKPRFSIHDGDLVNLGSDQGLWNTWFNTMEDLVCDSPCMPSSSNHDNNSTNFQHQFELPGNEVYYSFIYGNVYFIAIDVRNDGNTPDSAQTTWITNELAAADSNPGIKWKFAYFHTPLYSSSYSHGSNTAARSVLQPLFDQYGMDVVVCGHDHHYERTCLINNNTKVQDGPDFTETPAGTIYMVSGGAGAPLRSIAGDWYTKEYGIVNNYSIFSVSDGILTCTTYDNNDTQIDQFTITKTPSNPNTLPSKVSLSASMSPIPADGTSLSLITASVLNGYDELCESVTSGTFNFTLEGPEGCTLLVDETTEGNSRDVAEPGKTYMFLRAGTTDGLAAVTGSYGSFEGQVSVIIGSGGNIDPYENTTAFPNRLDAAGGSSSVVFSNIPVDSRIRIFTISGELVWTSNVTAGNNSTWNGANMRGVDISPGIYVYTISDYSGNTKTSKIIKTK